MIKVTRLTNATRDKLRPPRIGTYPDPALLAQLPQVRKNKPARKPARASETSVKAGGSPTPVKPPANGHIPDRANGLNAPATWRKTTPQPGKSQQPSNGGKGSSPLPEGSRLPPATPQTLPQAKPSSIRSARLAPGPNRNMLFMDRSVPNVRSVPELPASNRIDPAHPSKEVTASPRPDAPSEEKPVSRKEPGQNGTVNGGKDNGSGQTTEAGHFDSRNPLSPLAPTTPDRGKPSTPPAPTSKEQQTLSTPPEPGESTASRLQPVPGAADRGNTPLPPVAKTAPKSAPNDETRARALEQLLARHPDLPPQTAVLGVCDDGLPVLFDLFDPTPGAMAIIGDEREAQLEILRTLISSTAMRNTPRGVQFLILSVQPETWQQWIAGRGYDRYCLAITDVSDDSVREWTLRMADWTELRRLGQRSGPPVLIIMDTLSFLPKMAYDVRLNFDWMAKEGPPAAIWPLAAISCELALSLGSRMLRGFQSRILGYANDPSAYTQLANVTEEQAASLRSPGSFSVQLGENWLCFHLPEE